jgi:hypothetical protein
MNLGLIWAYFGLPRDKPTKLNLSEFKKISDFPDEVSAHPVLQCLKVAQPK